jgi:hypothetical protein
MVPYLIRLYDQSRHCFYHVAGRHFFRLARLNHSHGKNFTNKFSVRFLSAHNDDVVLLSSSQVVGAIIGFSCAAEGFDSINWKETIKIIISWFASPLVTGVVGFIIFFLIKHLILLSANPFNRGYYSFPVILFLTIGLNVFYVFAKGTKVSIIV